MQVLDEINAAEMEGKKQSIINGLFPKHEP